MLFDLHCDCMYSNKNKNKNKKKCYHLNVTSRKSQKLLPSKKSQSFPIANISSRQKQKMFNPQIKLLQKFSATRYTCIMTSRAEKIVQVVAAFGTTSNLWRTT